MGLFFSGDRAAGGFAAAQTLRAYWEGLRPRAGDIPVRTAVDPRGLAPILDRTFLAESIAPGQLRLRIAGMVLNELGGAEMKGLPLSLLFRLDAHEVLAAACQQVLDSPAIVEVDVEAERGLTRPALSARLLLLPLLASDGARRLVLGCLATEGRLGRCPRRFAVSRVSATALILPERATAAPATGAAGAGAERKRPDSETAAEDMSHAAATRRHLRLVHSV
ncbi:MAG: PAS domain-containing protein [Rhodobacteraceae bacterium]|jgi:hypothetical protein|nr:PAS domain-containing protein [Paracoccaceae bacterium]